jgi:hypothetical protein
MWKGRALLLLLMLLLLMLLLLALLLMLLLELVEWDVLMMIRMHGNGWQGGRG